GFGRVHSVSSLATMPHRCGVVLGDVAQPRAGCAVMTFASVAVSACRCAISLCLWNRMSDDVRVSIRSDVEDRGRGEQHNEHDAYDGQRQVVEQETTAVVASWAKPTDGRSRS